jgi:hypothetical protein
MPSSWASAAAALNTQAGRRTEGGICCASGVWYRWLLEGSLAPWAPLLPHEAADQSPGSCETLGGGEPLVGVLIYLCSLLLLCRRYLVPGSLLDALVVAALQSALGSCVERSSSSAMRVLLIASLRAPGHEGDH